MDWIKGIIQKLIRKKFHGKLIISFQNGQIHTAHLDWALTPGESLDL